MHENEYCKRAQLLIELRSYEAAQAVLIEGLSSEPNNAWLHGLLAALSFNSGKHDQARTAVNAAISLDASEPYFYYVSAIIYEATAKYAKAETAIRMALVLDVGNPEYHAELASVFYSRRKWDACEASVAEALKLNPYNKRANLIKARCFVERGQLSQAKLQITEMLQQYPESADAHITMGDLLTRQNQIMKALVHYREALRIDPDSRWAQRSLLCALRGDSTDLRLEPAKPQTMILFKGAMYWVVEFDAAISAFVFGASLFWFVLAYAICSISSHPEFSIAAGFALIGTALAILGRFLYSTKLRWNDSNLVYTDLLGLRTVRLAWSELYRFESEGLLQSFLIVSESGALIRLYPVLMTGFEKLANKLLSDGPAKKCLPLELADCVPGGRQLANFDVGDRQGDFRIVGPTRDQQVVDCSFFLLFLIMSVVILSSFDSKDPPRYYWSIAGLISCAIIMLNSVVRGRFAKLKWNLQSVEGRDFVLRKRAFRWAELNGVEPAPLMGSVILTSAKGDRIWVETRCAGFQLLASHIAECLAESSNDIESAG